MRMTCSKPAPFSINKACSGRCLHGGCNDISGVWIAAASEGLIALYQRGQSGGLTLLKQGESAVAPSLEVFRHTLMQGEHDHRIRQLILVGTANDIGWMHMSIPPEVSAYVTAEIEYPLLSAWFRSEGASELTNALSQVMQ